ncbi:hypothetical protein C0431_12665 [bacterium]|nr:hypothetical protein [bacterium]
MNKLLTRQQRRQQERTKQKKIDRAMARTYTGEELQQAIERTMTQAFVMMQSFNSESLRVACEETKGIGPDRQKKIQEEFSKAFEKSVTAKLKEVEEKGFQPK